MNNSVTLDALAVRNMLRSVAKHVLKNVDVLTDADLAIGDGDHGIGMRRGFEAALDSLDKIDTAESPELNTVKAAFEAVGSSIVSHTGGAAGAVFGTLFRAGAKSIADVDRLDAAGFATFLEAGLAGVLKRGGVVPGQKTMVDALAPASIAAREHANGALNRALLLAADAALVGLEATRNMVATTGKARSLGQRSLGHVDPGAITIVLILSAMRDYCSEI